MITNDIEKTLRCYLLNESTFSDALRTIPVPGFPDYMESINFAIMSDQGVPLDGGEMLRFYISSTDAPVKTPCCIIASSSAEQETETGNYEIGVEVMFVYPSTPYIGAEKPFASAENITKTFLAMLENPLMPQLMNQFVPDDMELNVFGVTKFSSDKGTDGDNIQHKISISFYAAPLNLPL